jgi:hypothetical protein
MEGSRRITWTIPVTPADFGKNREKQMRTIFIAMLTAATIGLLGTSETFAAPASGSVLGAAATTESLVQDVQFSRVRVIRDCIHRGFSRRVCRVIRRHR